MYSPLVLVVTIASSIALSKFAYDVTSFYDQRIPQWHCALAQRLKPAPAPTIDVAFVMIEGIVHDASHFIQMIDYLKLPHIKGVFIYFNSPGGNAGASEAVHYEIKELAKIKPVVALIGNVCISGGYLVASAASYIIASRGATIGNIGALRKIDYYDGNIEGSLAASNDFGNLHGPVKIEFIAAGSHKTVGSWHQPLSEQGRAYIQQNINACYEILCQLIADARHLSVDHRDIWADGKEFTGQEARDLGLIDACGSWTDAKNVMHKLIVQRVPNIRGSLNVVSVDTLFK